ncbi:solute carrier family 22 member 1-like [Cloeon dipterum]|uniref:solute carrier family 22 member 1-like n=1 Tax=Cloeon dipterum TaxID=197152 RepID=UPI00321FFF96
MRVADFDDVLEHVGGFGRYQKRLIVLALPFNLVLTAVYFGHSFVALTPRHWCALPELEAELNISDPSDLHYVGEEGGYPSWAVPFDTLDGGNTKPSQCTQYKVNFTQVLQSGGFPNNSWPTEPCRHGWRYDLHHDYATIVSEQDWVCGESWKPNLAQSIFFLGSALGSVILGWLGDHKGRLPVLVISNVIAFVSGVATAFTNGFVSFLIARFCIGLTYNNSFMMMYIIMLEYVSPAKRSMVANLPIAIFLTFGLVALPGLAYLLWSWRLFSILSSLPMCIAFLAPWLIPESGRWLLAQGRVAEAEKILRTIASVNGRPIEERVFTEFRAYSKQFAEASSKEQRSHNFIELFSTPVLRRRVILLTFLWMLMTVCYDGHVRNLGNLDYSLYVTFALTGLLELPADLLTIFTLDYLGRRWTNFLAMGLGAFFSLIAAAVQSSPLAVVILAGCGRFCITMAMNTGLQYCVELLPTQLRGQGVNFVHIAGHFSTFGGPLIAYLGEFSALLPFLLLGLLGSVGGAISLMLPETANENLPETAEESENFGADQPFCLMPCWEKRKLEQKQELEASRSQAEGMSNKSFTSEENIGEQQVERRVSNGVVIDYHSSI